MSAHKPRDISKHRVKATVSDQGVIRVPLTHNFQAQTLYQRNLRVAFASLSAPQLWTLSQYIAGLEAQDFDAYMPRLKEAVTCQQMLV